MSILGLFWIPNLSVLFYKYNFFHMSVSNSNIQISLNARKFHNENVLTWILIWQFSPYDFLESKEQFHKALPQNISEIKIREIDGILLVLITLYHIRKLLSAHGIQPAFDMLEEKLKQGYFCPSFSNILVIWALKSFSFKYYWC